MNVKEKKYTVQVHLWMTPEQKKKLTRDAKRLGISEADLQRKNIDRAFVYENLFIPILKIDKSVSDSMNQIAFWCNRNHGVSSDVLKQIEEIKHLIYAKYEEVRKLKK